MPRSSKLAAPGPKKIVDPTWELAAARPGKTGHTGSSIFFPLSHSLSL